jgi:hypothetical protein
MSYNNLSFAELAKMKKKVSAKKKALESKLKLSDNRDAANDLQQQINDCVAVLKQINAAMIPYLDKANEKLL